MAITLNVTKGYMDPLSKYPTVNPTVLEFRHSQGYINLKMSHDPMNALRAILMWAKNYPNTIILPEVPCKLYQANAQVEYYGYGSMHYTSTMNVEITKGSVNNSALVRTFSYNFDVSQYEHEDYNEDPYYFYTGQTEVNFELNSDIIEQIIPYMNRVYPYERFNRMNFPIYHYIK